MRWPFGPPHLTLKPSKKNKTQKNKKNKTKKNTKKNQKKTKTKKEKVKNTKIPKKELFSYQSKFSFFDRVSKNCLFLTPWPRKRAPQKHYKNRGFSLFFFGKEVMRHETAIFGQKKPKFINSSYHFYSCLFFSFKNKKHKNLLKPLFLYSVLANLKKENFPKINLKHRNLKNPIFAPIFWKRPCLDNCQIIGHKKNTKW